MLLIPTFYLHQMQDPNSKSTRYLRIQSVGRGISGRRRDWRETRCRRGHSSYTNLPCDAMTVWWNHQRSLHLESWRVILSSPYGQFFNESPWASIHEERLYIRGQSHRSAYPPSIWPAVQSLLDSRILNPQIILCLKQEQHSKSFFLCLK